jgi:hypothetical protein
MNTLASIYTEIWSHKASNKGATLESDGHLGSASAFETRLRPLLRLHRLPARSTALAPTWTEP